MLKVKRAELPGKLEVWVRNIICAFALVILGFCLIESFMHTMELRKSDEAFEGIIYHSDNFLVNAICIAVVLLLVALVIPYLEKIPIGIQMGVLAAVTITLGSIWVLSSQSAPTEDSFMVTNAARMASEGDYSFMSDRYFSNYSFQLGFVLYCECFMRLFGPHDTLLYFEFINVVLLAAAYMGLILILRRLFHSKRIQTIACLTLLFCMQPILFSVFIYGVIPGITFAIYAVLCEILYFQSEKKIKYLWAACSAVCIALAAMVKLNNYIILIAMVMMALIKLVQRRKLSDLIYIVVAVLLTLSINSSVCKLYEARSDTKLNDSLPMISYAVMGLNYPYNVVGCTAAGWYNGSYTLGNFESHNYDAKEAAAASKEQIKERLSYFAHHYQETNDFFYEKNMSQWNEPTYASIWINIVRIKYQEVGKIATYVCDTAPEKTTQYMNVYQLLIFLGAFAGVFCCWKKKDVFCPCFLLIIVGAFFYHMIFEGKSQYILPYFLLLCGFSAVGMDFLSKKVEAILPKWGKKKQAQLVTDAKPEETI